MRGLIFVLCSCVAITTIAGSWIDNASRSLGRGYHLPTEDVKACFVENNITLADSSVAARIVINEDTSDVQDSALKVGCVFACIFKKKGWLDGTLKIKVIMEEYNPMRTNPVRSDEIVDTCYDQVKHLTNECEIMLNYIKCSVAEQRASI